jgi:WD40 repeat protein/energy-coupling factor transporter ATP-binding protein EcfA2
MNEERRNPFPGLRPFEYHEYELFFGREEQYEEMIARLSETRFLAVVGTSGSGKSSLVKAGLLPALYGGLMMSAGPSWRIAVFRPKDDPIRELALALNHNRVFGDRSKTNGSSDFKLSESTNWSNLCAKVAKEANEKERNPSGRVLEVLSADNRTIVSGVSQEGDIKDRSKIVQAFNGILKLRDFYRVDDFRGVPFSSEVRELLARDQDSLTEREVQKLNRLLLEASFPQEIANKIESQAQITEVGLRRGDLGLIEVAREAKMAREENLLVVVDQFEELFRYARISENGPHGNQAAAFVKLLLQASAQTDIPIYVVLTMRSDYLGDCAKFWGLPEAINKGQYLIPRLTRDQRREAIQGPIGLRGAKITPQLVNQLLNDMGDDPDQLPILQHALMRTWDQWEKTGSYHEPIEMSHYEAIGKMAEALSIHADEAYEELPDDRSREIAERIFRCLAERGTGHSEVRRPTGVSELNAITGATFKELNSVLNVFRKEGRSFLLPAARKPLRRETLIDISHESLIRNWKKLRQWVNREVDSANVYRRLVQTARLHEQNQAGTLTDLEVHYASRWKNENKPNVVWASRYHLSLTRDEKTTTETTSDQEADRDNKIFEGAMSFLAESQDMSNRKARTRKLTKILVVASVFLVVMVPLLVLQLLRMNTESRVRARLTYSAEMKLAQRELENGNVAEVNRLLHDAQGTQGQAATMNLLSWDRLLPARDDTALRGFEWHHFWKLTHNETSTIGRYEDAIISLAYLSGSDTLAMAESKGEIMLWDAAKGNLPIKSIGAPPEASFVAFASDRKSVAIAQQNGSIGLWELSPDLSRLTAKRELRSAQFPPVDSIAYSPNGRYVVAGMQGYVTVWPVNGDEKPYIIAFSSSDKNNHVSLAFSSDNHWLAIGLNQIVKLVDLTTRQAVSEINLANVTVENSTPSQAPGPHVSQHVEMAQNPPKRAAPITCLAFSPNGQILAMGRRDTNITLWDLNTNSYLLSLKGHSMEVLALVFSNEHQGALASASRDGGIKIWNMKKLSESGDAKTKEEKLRNEAQTLNGHSGPVTALVFTRDQKTLVSASDDRSLKVWSIEPRLGAEYEIVPPSTLPLLSSVSSLAFSPDNVWLAAARNDGSAVVWNVGQYQSVGMELVPARSGEPRVVPVAFSKDQVLAIATENSNVTLWKTNNLGQKLKILSNGHSAPVLALAFSPDGKLLATGGGDKAITVWDVATGSSYLLTVLQNSDAILSLAFSPDAKTLAIGTNKTTVVLWDLDTKKEVGALKGHTDAVTSIAFSKDGSVIATGSADTTAKLWDAHDYKCFATFQGHSQRVLSLSFFTEGKRLATASEDGSVKLWDSSYDIREEDLRNALITFPSKEGSKPAFVVATSPDGLTLATGNADGTVKLRYGASKADIEKQSSQRKN